MPRAFATITFTDGVKAAQTRYGSREANRGFELADDPRAELTPREAEFILARDSFYQATVAENGWPYVQHRGGSAGFLKVLDAHTIGYADLRGNAQYLSVGNLGSNDRISLILMDYPNRRRLKLWGRVRIVHEQDEPELVARLEVASYRARVERGIVITVEAWEWNCPQHITPRYTDAEIEALMAPLQAENAALKAKASQSAPVLPTAPTVLGNGPLELVISGIRQLSPQVRAFELRHPEGGELPAITAGAHLQVPVVLADGQAAIRHYSISSNPKRRDAYEIAVLLEAQGKGGSRFAHEHFSLGMRLRCSLPRNDFALHDDARPAVLIAGGIGITPIKAMALQRKAAGLPVQIHYAGRSEGDMAYRDRLQREFGTQLSLYPTAAGRRMNLTSLLADAPADAVFYICGPNRLIEGVVAAATELGIDPARVRFERFAAPAHGVSRPFEVELRRSRKVIQVAAAQTVLDAVQKAGVDALADCAVGNCGTCAVKVLEGEPEHCDNALTPAERERGRKMCICVSRAKSERLVLDL
ncbi:2Fe-2S iron-sulfur cluster-binding protein [Parachitinimonas caeni]|uniref:Pyridoxamine 5'-phosphate oxidase family protein n=1 Tax=Parachitinimonas caeni TaxID=3031301 RepID=A0ABT7E3L0_9NEIS|nr:pyridoxamine 5'-phosphate oxidase family protein [Parachitinimonas caeni]MDK2126907.1 pyridoxamine 5'-phosphate oxidase family protein [Parachitinimonas caeni]